MRHVVNFSGGLCSWLAAKRVADEHGTDRLVLLFADTMMEDHDLYRFLNDAAANIGVPITRIADGRTPWDIFRDNRFLGNARVDKCSQYLKRRLLDEWRADNCDPAETVVYVGLNWDEWHRFERFQARMHPWTVNAPLMSQPLLSKDQMIDVARTEGLRPSRAYEQGFPHDNCGGFCIKAGQAHFALLLRERPDVFAFHEQQEREFRAWIGKDVSILRDRTGGQVRTLTLEALRARIESNQQIDFHEWGGCGCAIE
jgi:hypothetical protein